MANRMPIRATKQTKTKARKILDGYTEISKQEIRELRKMSAKESLTRGFRLIDDIEKLSESMKNGRAN